MTRRNLAFLLPLVIGLLASVTNAGPYAVSSGTPLTLSGASETGKCLEVWCQAPASSAAIESQISDNPPEVVLQIDDFTAATDEAVTMIKWWGYLAAGSGPVDRFVLTFYRSVGCTGPEGDAFAERAVASWTEVAYDETVVEYTATFDPVLMDAGATYWVSVVAEMNIDPGGYWLWASASPTLCPAMAMAPTFGILGWTPVYPMIFPDVPELEARAFCLYTDGAVPLEQASWGGLKALFR
jgi:hypothetical protein